MLEDHQLAPGDPALDRLGEARGQQTMSRAPKVISVGTSISLSAALASWAMTASVWARNASTGWAGRLRTKSTSVSTNSGRSTYISGVKHHGKIPWITTSTVGSVDASVRHCSMTIFT